MAASPSEYGDPQQAVYTRNQLLAVYTSPLVPSRLEGMKELADWYGEFTDPPSPPPQRHGLPSRPSHTGSDRGERGTPSRRPVQNDPSNPFTNFGRFGVDGGLGSALEEGLGSSGRRRRGERSAGSGGAGGDDNKDLAPHLGGARGGSALGGLRSERSGGGGGFGRNDRDEGGSSPTRERSSFLTDRFAELRSGGDRDRRNGRNGGERDRDRERDRDSGLSGRSSGLGGGDFERRKIGGEGAASGSSSSLDPLGGASRKEMRRGIGPADEGGWRNVGLSREEREKRLIRNNSSGASLDSPRADRERDRNDRGDRRERDRDFERNGNSRLGGGRPSWMDDDGPNGGSSPAWMDAPATGNMSFGSNGKVDEGEEKMERESDGKPPGLSGLGGGGKGGMDSIQAWKAQMKEMERKERERDLKAAGIAVESTKEDERAKEADAAQASVFGALTGSGSTSTASANEGKSIFEDLGITRPPPGLPLPKQAGGGGEEARGGGGGEAGGRGSRFARFFDGKPPTTQAQSPSMTAAQAPSVFGALMAGSGTSGEATSVAGGAAGTPGPSKEDADSMARLLGMLQVSGARTSSPPTSMKSPPQPAPPQILSPPVASAQPPSALASPALSSAANSTSEGRSGSRFKFSKSAAASPAQPAQPPIPQMQSPALAGAIQPPPPPGFGFPLSGGPPPADPRSPPQQSRPGPPNGIDAPSSVATTSPPAAAPQQQQKQQQQQPQPPHSHQSNPPFSPPIPPPGMPPQFFNGPPPGARFPPGQLPPGMPPFALGSDGRPIPPPNGFPGGGPGSSPFPSPGAMLRNGPLSPPISNAGSGISHPSPQAPHPSQQPPQHNGPPQFPPRNGPLSPPLPGQPPHVPGGSNGMPPFPPPPHSSPFPPGAPMPPPHLFPGSNGMPPFPPPPPMGFLPPHLAGRGPGGPPPPPPGMFGGGGGGANPGADLMALLNSGAAGTRIGPMGAPQGQQGPR